MIATRQPADFTPKDYFDWESKQPVRYEYFDGQVFAMAGGTLQHADIALNVALLLRRSLGDRCKVRNSDAKVGITADGPFVYPDVSVTCDQQDFSAQQFSQHPCVIVEVLSASTEAYDRGGKFALYRRLESLQAYILISSEEQLVEVFRQDEKGQWIFTVYGENDCVDLTILNVTLPLAAIYENVAMEQPARFPEG